MGVQDVNRSVIAEISRAWNERDAQAFIAAHAEAVLVRTGEDVTTESGQSLWDGQEGLFEIFGDLRVDTDAVVVEGAHVVVCWTTRGIHRGTIQGVTGTGHEVAWQEWAHYVLADGRVVEVTFLSDLLSLYRQVGVVTLPEQPPPSER